MYIIIGNIGFNDNSHHNKNSDNHNDNINNNILIIRTRIINRIILAMLVIKPPFLISPL